MPPPQISREDIAAPSAPQSQRKLSFQISEPLPLHPRLIINGVEGWGKTTLAAYAPDPVLINTPAESAGYETLLSTGLVPNIPRVTVQSWPELLAIPSLPKSTKTLVIDALGSVERLCQDFVCKRDFNGDWGERGFESYGKGYSTTAFEWTALLAALDKVNEQGITILLLCHASVKGFKNPMGSDFDRYTSALHDKVWQATKNWSDAVLFCNFIQIVTKDKQGKVKGTGGSDRIIYTERSDAWDAKNRFAMPAEIMIPDKPSEVWNTVSKEIFKTREKQNEHAKSN